MAEKILFPMTHVNITTGPNELSHKGANAIDNAGKDTGMDPVFAPFTGTVKKIWTNGNTVWLESTAPVLFADGTVDYATVNLTHDNNIAEDWVGRTFKQGEKFYDEGTAGNASGNHIHMSIAKGKFTGTGWYQNNYGVWELNNSVNPAAAFWLKPDTTVINSRGLNFKREQGEVVMDKEAVDELYRVALGREPDESAKAWIGMKPHQALWNMRNSPEWLSRNHIALVAYPALLEQLKQLQATSSGAGLDELKTKTKELMADIDAAQAKFAKE